jgi:hypothetical protein
MAHEPTASDSPVLAGDRDVIVFDTPTEARDLAAAMVAQGCRSALLFTRRLDPLLYDNPAFVSGLSQLVRAYPRSHCRVLLQDPEGFAAQDHRLITLSQTLSSFIQLRVVPEEARDELQAFLIIDGRGYLRRPNSAIYEGNASFNDPREARELGHLFEQWWEQSSELVGARRLHI